MIVMVRIRYHVLPIGFWLIYTHVKLYCSPYRSIDDDLNWRTTTGTEFNRKNVTDFLQSTIGGGC